MVRSIRVMDNALRRVLRSHRFFPAVVCVFSAKLLGASLSIWIGRLLMNSKFSYGDWDQKDKYFHLLSRGVEQDCWKFVAMTKVGFVLDFLLPTVVGCLPMILQNTSIGSLVCAAVALASNSRKSQVWSFIFPVLGFGSSILISWRIKKYSSGLKMDETETSSSVGGSDSFVGPSKTKYFCR